MRHDEAPRNAILARLDTVFNASKREEGLHERVGREKEEVKREEPDREVREANQL